MLAVPLGLCRAISRRLLAEPPLRFQTPCRTRGRGLAGARAGATPSTVRAAPKNTAWASACSPALTRPWARRLSPR
eukprot:2768786-Alexandrium_andersonii.AAC.1